MLQELAELGSERAVESDGRKRRRLSFCAQVARRDLTDPSRSRVVAGGARGEAMTDPASRGQGSSMPDYTPYQRRIIQRYYERKPEIMLQKLGELVSELAVETDEGKRRRLWARAEKALRNLKVPSARIARILEAQDPKLLAKVVEDFF